MYLIRQFRAQFATLSGLRLRAAALHSLDHFTAHSTGDEGILSKRLEDARPGGRGGHAQNWREDPGDLRGLGVRQQQEQRQQAAGSRQQAAGSRQQAAGSSNEGICSPAMPWCLSQSRSQTAGPAYC